MGRGHCCPQWGGISNIFDVGVMRSSLRESHAPGAFPKLWGKSVSVQPPPDLGKAALCCFLPPEQRPGEQGWWEWGGAGAGGTSGSPAAKSRTVQGISPPEFGQEIWLRPVRPTAHRQLLLRPEQGKENQG